MSKDFKYKSRIVKRNVKDENGQKRTVEEKVVVYWSRKFQARCERENKKFLDFLKKIEESPENFHITALQSKSLKKFFKKDCVNQKTGEVMNSSDIKTFIDFDKVAEYRKSMGYYQIVTSELTMEPLEVIDKYHGLTQIEDQFRVMKGDLETRPLYVRTPEHIEAHLLICMIALIMLRIIQKRMISSNVVSVPADAYWSSGLSGERIQMALNKWSRQWLRLVFLSGKLGLYHIFMQNTIKTSFFYLYTMTIAKSLLLVLSVIAIYNTLQAKITAVEKNLYFLLLFLNYDFTLLLIDTKKAPKALFLP